MCFPLLMFALFLPSVLGTLECLTDNSVRKCCPLGQEFSNRTCIPSKLKIDSKNLTRVAFMSKLQCSESEYKFMFTENEFNLTETGTLEISVGSVNSCKYCVDFINRKWAALVCYKKFDEETTIERVSKAKGKALLKNTLFAFYPRFYHNLLLC